MTNTNTAINDDPGDEWVRRRLAIKAARAKEWPDMHARRPDRPILEGINHGKEWGYQRGCGCDPCREARRQSQARQRANQRARLRLVAA